MTTGIPLSAVGVRTIYFWNDSVSPHVSDLVRGVALANPQVEVRFATLGAPNAQDQSWSFGKLSLAPAEVIHVQPAEVGVHVTGDASTIHVLLGYRHGSLTQAVRRVLSATMSRTVVVAECGALEGSMGALRRARSRLRDGDVRRMSLAVFAIGRHGPPWYRSVGFNPGRVFPFAYFISPLAPLEDVRGVPSRAPVVGFIGRYEESKGVDDLIQAANELGPTYCFRLFGAGSRERHLREAAGPNVEIHGRVSRDDIARQLANMTCLVLPSRSSDDGWGVVVSEALMQGLPVVVTDRVGSSEILIQRPDLGGAIVPASTPARLASSIETTCSGESLRSRTSRAATARDVLGSDNGAEYFAQVVGHSIDPSVPRPVPYWVARESTGGAGGLEGTQ